MSGQAHGEDGRIIPSTDFDWEAVERNLFTENPEDLSELSQEDIDRALKVLRVLLQWVWQNGMKNVDGLKIRAIIVCWIFLKELRPLTLTQLATGFGLKKQSVGRWVDQFKKDFKRVRISHMR